MGNTDCLTWQAGVLIVWMEGGRDIFDTTGQEREVGVAEKRERGQY
jgi:hypothetical protein